MCEDSITSDEWITIHEWGPIEEPIQDFVLIHGTSQSIGSEWVSLLDRYEPRDVPPPDSDYWMKTVFVPNNWIRDDVPTKPFFRNVSIEEAARWLKQNHFEKVHPQ